MKNPFIADDSGRLPLHIAGRESQILDIKRISSVDEDPRKKNILITGLRGVGKTVLLNYLSSQLKENNWLPVVITIFENKGRRSRDLLVHIIEEFAIELDKVLGEGSSLEQFREVYKATDGSMELRIQAVLEYGIDKALKSGKKGVMLGFDEAQFIVDNKAIDEYPRSSLLSILARIQSTSKPFFYAFCGLPNLLVSLQESKPNFERAISYYEKLESLDETHSEDLIVGTLEKSDEGITFETNLIKRIIKVSAGYPYFLQYYCGKLIDLADRPGENNQYSLAQFEILEKKITEELDKKFYDSRFELISDSDKKYFMVTLSLAKPFLPKDLLEAYNKKYPGDEKTQVAIRQAIFRLTQKGILLKKPNGYDYTIPLIEKYLSRKNHKDEELF